MEDPKCHSEQCLRLSLLSGAAFLPSLTDQGRNLLTHFPGLFFRNNLEGNLPDSELPKARKLVLLK